MAAINKGDRTDEQVKQEVREYYGAFAQRSTSCCSEDAAEDRCTPVAGTIYSAGQTEGLPEDAVLAAAGCGNPIALGSLREGETVVDFGSGGGIDCFLAARAVGPSGRVIGIDMTRDMIDLARRNAAKIGACNTEFHLAEMEDTRLDSSSADVVISNCVICLAPDKDAVFREAFRILKPGGRMYVSDVILDKPPPQDFVPSPRSWVSCTGGAELKPIYMRRLRNSGFNEVDVISDLSYPDVEMPNLRSLSYVAYKPSRADPTSVPASDRRQTGSDSLDKTAKALKRRPQTLIPWLPAIDD